MTALRLGRTEAALGAIGAVALIALTPTLPSWAGSLLLWAVLLTAVLVAQYRLMGANDEDSLRPTFRLQITWMDVLVGAFVGLLLRCVMIAIELLTLGYLSSSSSMFVVEHDFLWAFTAIIAPGIIAPFVEELFFRGLVLPAIGANWIGIVGSAIMFSAIHLAYGFNTLTAVSTFIAGIAFGVLAVRTKRLGASVTAHIIYNASLIAISELGGLTPMSN
jgi:membrane protease YdiL (CAAX protease family)